ncbi:hypothetical protein AVEN_235869-1, partial [Araneus ventricosus]
YVRNIFYGDHQPRCCAWCGAPVPNQKQKKTPVTSGSNCPFPSSAGGNSAITIYRAGCLLAANSSQIPLVKALTYFGKKF